MKVTELIDKSNIFDTPGTRTRWIASGAVKINGSVVSLEDDVIVEEIHSIQVGNKIMWNKETTSIASRGDNPDYRFIT